MMIQDCLLHDIDYKYIKCKTCPLQLMLSGISTVDFTVSRLCQMNQQALQSKDISDLSYVSVTIITPAQLCMQSSVGGYCVMMIQDSL